MRYTQWPILMCLFGAFVSQSVQANPCQTLSQVNWMLGDWVAESPSGITRESWNATSDKTYEGTGKSVFNNIETTETLRLVSMSNQVFFIAKVAGNPLPVAFAGQKCEQTSVEFVNPRHDFPTRIVYTLISSDQLQAKVSGADGKGFRLLFTQDKQSE